MNLRVSMLSVVEKRKDNSLGCRVGLLINFNVPVLKDGIKRRVL